MFFTKEDRRKLNFLYNSFRGLQDVDYRDPATKERLKKIVPIEEEQEIKVHGSNSYDALVDKEEEDIIDRVSSRLNEKSNENFMFEEEGFTAEELEAME